ncbi:uncharacterized protein LOC18429372 [Amborella trichopoda]|uniref:Small multi-drug export protein n=1 Tax=Amborella trichopoda TaxID=13333 RepID=W1P2W2_AMBTC|nr:uncharacterized protein LOC18429372 [Amborella trichopoda]ERN01290.1 hypothetical protein AMTR_s00002p00252170 [Amborella trichopoda]|eukprot:XP_006838721.1 uncharacterized protein LOC18429372 [Amborella trichopoda]
MASIGAVITIKCSSSLCHSPSKLHFYCPPPQTHLLPLLHGLRNFRPIKLQTASSSFSQAPPVAASFTCFISNPSEEDELKKEKGDFLLKSLKFVGSILFCLSLSLALAIGAAYASTDSIKASRFGLKIAEAMRKSGWADEAIVFALAILPVIELRGAIPVGYWMHLKPLHITLLSVIGNMVPVPIILMYLKRLANFLAQRNASASKFMDLLFERAREKAGPVEEFQWLGLMLFVAIPFPGTGAWTGAIVASILDMPFWSAVSANFFGVVLAGLLVNLLVNLGLKYAIVTGIILFFVSTVMWSVLRNLKKSLDSN